MLQYSSFTFNPVSENTYIAWDETGEACIIDPGCSNKQEEDRLEEFITTHHLIPTRCLCTHVHFDHIWGSSFVYNKWGLSPECSEKDIKNLPSFLEQARAFGLPTAGLQEIPPIVIPEYHSKRVKIGHSYLNILEVPGHSPGHLAYHSEEAKILFSGDVLFRGDIGRTDLWGGDYDTLIRSIKTQIFVLPDETKVLSGHGPSTSVHYEIEHNPYTK